MRSSHFLIISDVDSPETALQTEEELPVQGIDEDDEDFNWRLQEIQEQHRQRQIEEERTQISNALRIRHLRILTVGYCLCYFALGLAFGATAPAIHKLKDNTGAPLPPRPLIYLIARLNR